jgi:hypothetical protein
MLYCWRLEESVGEGYLIPEENRTKRESEEKEVNNIFKKSPSLYECLVSTLSTRYKKILD